MLTMIEYLVTTLMGLCGITSIKSQKGVTMIEYALIAALIAVAVIVILGTVGGQLNTIFTTISGKLGSSTS